MRALFADLYADIGLTQTYVSIGYWVEDVRESDYFTMDDLERIQDVFGDKIAYMDSSAYLSGDARAGEKTMKFELTGVDYNYQDVQPVKILFGPRPQPGGHPGAAGQTRWWRRGAPSGCSGRRMPWGGPSAWTSTAP